MAIAYYMANRMLWIDDINADWWAPPLEFKFSRSDIGDYQILLLRVLYE